MTREEIIEVADAYLVLFPSTDGTWRMDGVYSSQGTAEQVAGKLTGQVFAVFAVSEDFHPMTSTLRKSDPCPVCIKPGGVLKDSDRHTYAGVCGRRR